MSPGTVAMPNSLGKKAEKLRFFADFLARLWYTSLAVFQIS
jgi:hypothetical protein